MTRKSATRRQNRATQYPAKPLPPLSRSSFVNVVQSPAGVWNNEGINRLFQDWEVSVQRIMRAHILQPHNAHFMSNLGDVYLYGAQYDKAEFWLRKALQADPNLLGGHHNLGIVLMHTGRYDEAVEHFRETEKLQKDYYNGIWDEGLALLAAGRWEEGWRVAEVRLLRKAHEFREYPFPRWDGEDLAGKQIFVHAEQGFGDVIQFSRYIPWLASKADSVVFDIHYELLELFDGLRSSCQLQVQGREPVPKAADYHVPLMSLPLYHRTTIHNVPPCLDLSSAVHSPSRESDDPLVNRTTLPKPWPSTKKIGIVWAGRETHERDRQRSMSIKRFLPLVGRIDKVTLFSLQYGPRSKDIVLHGLGSMICDVTPLIKNFCDTAAILEQLDLLISVDTSVVHLAGTLGVPTWLLTDYAAEWRWLHGRSDTPWYPSVRIFRQPRPGDWDAVMAEVYTLLCGAT